MYNNMQRRTNEGPMDWEWQTQGPRDPKSPFPQFEPQLGQGTAAPPAPAPQFRNPSFTTPRKPFDQELLSEVSGAESSPADNADAEDTPDIPRQNRAMTAFTSGGAEKPIFNRYGAEFSGSSPGRAERRGKFGIAVANKLRKRKRADRDYAPSHARGSDTDSETETRPRSSKNLKSIDPNAMGWFAALLSGIESRPNLPHILSYYAQLMLNFFFAFIIMFGIWTFWLTIRADVDKASEDSIQDVVAEMSKCKKEFLENNCANLKSPALQVLCDNWEKCMNRDPMAVARAKISAHTFAEIFNSFIEPISYKAMIFIVLIITVVILINNLTFNLIRSKASHLPHPTIPPVPQYFPPHQNFQWGVPQTPTHQTGFEYGNGQSFQAIMPSTPQQSPSKGRSPSKGGDRSPSKGERY
ncbi:hypothetical protein B7494_g7105 [Chlorociboria aeruginascens]|nr:hypothetical protein B7494_g7105 [Chlorociboria aeruginascens]